MSKPAPATSHAHDVLLSIVDIARHFSLPESTARYYCKRFAPFIPTCGEGRRRRFRPEVIPVIQTVLEVMRSSRTATAVEQELTLRYPRNAESNQASIAVSTPLPATTEGVSPARTEAGDLPALALHLLQQQSHALENIGTALQLMVTRQQQLDHLTDQARAAAEENSLLREEVGKLRQQLYATEALQQSDLEQLRTWMGRIVRTRASNV
ncbi:MAG: MerR family transcriptional regulator [Desulfovibrionaceae bacterium]